MTAMALVGAVIGGLLFAVIWRLVAPQPSPLVQLARFDAHRDRYARRSGEPNAGSSVGATGTAVPATATRLRVGPVGSGRRLARAGAWVAHRLAERGIEYTSLRQDLALTGGSMDTVLARKVFAAGAGLVLVTGTAITVRVAAGWAWPPAAVAVAAIAVAAGLSFLPDAEARHEASRRRQEFRRALAAYLDLVALEMAGSAAPAEALPNAARVGEGWAMVMLRETLWRASLSGQDQWEALTDLGARIGVGELADLGALVRLVGRDGARIRQTLTARAATMRRAQLADAEGEAGEKDQSMRLAQILIGFGFIVFLTYPAVVNVLAF
ncbi:MAG: type II secretion system protein [Kineosporiaceae bacterium]|nr:type II secretion system protein [Kineosporiaceae bacterium]